MASDGLTQQQRYQRTSRLNTARRLMVGGASWTVIRTSGDGVTAPVTETSIGTVACYVWRRPPSRQATAVSGAESLDDDWVVTAKAGANIQKDDMLLSVSQPSLAFVIRSFEAAIGYLEARLEFVGAGYALEVGGGSDSGTASLDFSQAGNSMYIGMVN
jgi:hypothetical protein